MDTPSLRLADLATVKHLIEQALAFITKTATNDSSDGAGNPADVEK